MGISDITIDYERNMLRKEKLPDAVKKAISDFVDGDLLLENLSERRRLNYYQRLRIVARWIPDGFTNPTKDDLKQIMIHLSGGYSEWTRATYLKMIKKFYRKTLSKPVFEALFEDLKIKQPRQKIQQSDLITPDEIARIVEACNNARDRAIFSTLYDSGCRIGELLLMRIRNVRFDNYGGILEVPFEGKTGARQVRVVGNSIPHLRAWLDNHPRRNDINAPLFCNLAEDIRGRTMTYDDIRKALKSALRRAGITKRIYPHLFRHTRASLLASKVAEAPLEAQMGWVPGTKQMATYVHLSGKQTDAAILKAYGVEVSESTLSEPIPQKCPRCGEPNASDSVFCRKCWLPFDVKAALDQEAKENELRDALMLSPDLDPVLKTVILSLPEESKLKVLESVLKGLQDRKNGS